MAQRYQRQVREQSAPAAFGHAGGGGIQAVSEAGALMSGLGDVIGKFAEITQKRQEEWDAASVMNAQNEYMRAMSEWMDHPETGQAATRKLGNARGLTEEAWAQGDKVAEDIAAQLENKQQRAAFMKIAPRLKMQYWKQASEHEAKEVKAYKDQVFNTTLETQKSAALKDPAYAGESLRMIENAVRAQMYGADEAVIRRVIDEQASDLYGRIITARAQDDPVGALKMINDPDTPLLPETLAKLKGQIEGKAQVYEVQEIVDKLIEEYPPDRAQEAFKKIHQDYEGPKENSIVSAYNSRVQEITVNEGRELTAKRREREALEEELEKELYFDKTMRPRAEMETLWREDKISKRYFDQYEARRSEAATQAGILKGLEANPAYQEATPDVQYTARASALFGGPERAQEIREASLEWLMKGLLNGSLNEATIDELEKSWKISPTEAKNFKNFISNMKEEQKAIVSQHRSDLEEYVKLLPWQVANKSDMWLVARNEFDRRVKTLDPTAGNYAAQVREATVAAVLKALDASGESSKTPTELTRKVDALIDIINKEGEPIHMPEETPLVISDDKPVMGTDPGGLFGIPAGPAARDVTAQVPVSQDVAQPVSADVAPEAAASEFSEPAPAPVDISSVENPQSVYEPKPTPKVQTPAQQNFKPVNTESVPMSMVQYKGAKVTSQFENKRPGGRSHHATDVWAPKGTPIIVPNLGCELKVGMVGYDPKAPGGVQARLEGKLPDGRRVELKILHMDVGSVKVKVNQTIKAGDLIGLVGNTGNTSEGKKITPWRPDKKTGCHLHLTMKVNGKVVDPEKFA